MSLKIPKLFQERINVKSHLGNKQAGVAAQQQQANAPKPQLQPKQKEAQPNQSAEPQTQSTKHEILRKIVGVSKKSKEIKKQVLQMIKTALKGAN